MKSGVLKKAYALFQKKRFAQVISLLEPQVFLFRENTRFYYMLGVSCLYADDTGGAYSYLKRAHQLDSDDIRVMHALAAVHLKRREPEDSLRLWLSILDREPKNRIAQRGLDLIKRNIEPGMLVEAIEVGRVKALYPKPPFRIPRWVLPAAAALFVIVPAILFVAPIVEKRIHPPASERTGASVLKIDPSDKNLVEYSGSFRFMLTPAQIAAAFVQIEKSFNTYHDNLAMMEANRILQSNASAVLKQKASLIRSYLRKPDFVTFADNFTYQQVTETPDLYAGCYVKWKGKVSNLHVGATAITFEFLVGYQDEKVLEGTVPVTMNFAADIRDAQSLEIIAKVIPQGSHTFALEATSIRPLLPAGGS